MIVLLFSCFNGFEIQGYLTIDRIVWIFPWKYFIKMIAFLTNDIILEMIKYCISSSSDPWIKDPLFITFAWYSKYFVSM